LIRKIIYTCLILLGAVILWHNKLVLYGIEQGIGQAKIVLQAEPVDVVLKDPTFPDSLKKKIILIEEIKKFAFDSIGIKKSDNYSSIYNQHGKPILWVLTASEQFALKAKEWSFPFLGAVSYKGFFNYQKGLAEQQELINQGYDTDYDVVSGWSTLGWFNDPVLSNMLLKKEGNLANLIIHELTHGTIYVKSSVEFNENLASFIGDKGAEEFLNLKFGKNSLQYIQYEQGKFDMALYSGHILMGAKKLDSLYKSFSVNTTVTLKKRLKKQLIEQIIESANALPFYKKNRFSKLFAKDRMPNNAFFIDYKRYMSKQDQFELEYKNRFHGNLKNYLNYLKTKYNV
jgi:predicted aminopeptidase